MHPVRFGGGIGRHAGLKIPWAAMPVRVRFPSEAQNPSQEILERGFYLYLISKSTRIGRWSEGRQKFERFCGSRTGVVYSSQMISA